jgi:hypothetical protein
MVQALGFVVFVLVMVLTLLEFGERAAPVEERAEERLRRLFDVAPVLVAWARAHGAPDSYVSEVEVRLEALQGPPPLDRRGLDHAEAAMQKLGRWIRKHAPPRV